MHTPPRPTAPRPRRHTLRGAAPWTARALLAAAMLAAGGCQAHPPAAAANAPETDVPAQPAPEPASEPAPGSAWSGQVLLDFNDGQVPAWLAADQAELTVAASDASGGRELRVRMNASQNEYSGIVIEPDAPWDWSGHQDFNLAMDMAAPGERSTQVMLSLTDGRGRSFTRSVVVSPGPMKTYYCKLDGHDVGSPGDDDFVELNLASGMRSNPPTWSSDDVQFAWLWGTKNLDLGRITRIRLSTKASHRDKGLRLDNVRLRPNPPVGPGFLAGLVDRYGQNAKTAFEGKVGSDQELLAARDAELARLDGQAMADRSRFGGWKDGPRLDATGKFRTQKHGGRWWLIDPEGYLYFASGITSARLGDAATMTGYAQAPHGADRVVASDVRAGMFDWLPDHGSPLAAAYGYAAGVHSGALDAGETINFYELNLQRKYGADYRRAWRDVTLDRMLDWGFTCLGNWAAPSYFDNTKVPYFAHALIRGDFKTVSSGNDFWHPLPDPFDPRFEEVAQTEAQALAGQVNDSPWCVGVFVDNELSFGRPGSDESVYGLVIHTLGRDGAASPAKAAFTRLLRDKYGTVAALNAVWTTGVASWEAFDAGIDARIRNPQQVADYSLLLEAYGVQYHRTIQAALRQHLPGYLYLGSRLPDWGRPMEVVRAAAAHSDVITYNHYQEGLAPHNWAFLDELDMPSLIGEFQIGAVDAGHFHFGIICADGQQERATMYSEYMQTVFDNPYMVGAHWFQYIDSPVTGRAYDGENYNNGFVNVTDTPYRPLVEAARTFHRGLYPRLAGPHD